MKSIVYVGMDVHSANYTLSVTVQPYVFQAKIRKCNMFSRLMKYWLRSISGGHIAINSTHSLIRSKLLTIAIGRETLIK